MTDVPESPGAVDADAGAAGGVAAPAVVGAGLLEGMSLVAAVRALENRAPIEDRNRVCAPLLRSTRSGR